jgi:hypothetical protein
LHADQPTSPVENQVVTTAFTDGSIHIETELDGCERDRRLGDVSLLVGGEFHPDMLVV